MKKVLVAVSFLLLVSCNVKTLPPNSYNPNSNVVPGLTDDENDKQIQLDKAQFFLDRATSPTETQYWQLQIEELRRSR